MIWFALALVFALIALHPFTIYPASLYLIAYVRPARIGARAPGPASGPGTGPEAAGRERVAIVLCALNEEAVIEEKLRNCLEVADADTRIYVYADGCSDSTVEIARRYEPKVEVLVSEQRRGKSFGMNQLARMARLAGAEIIFFTDANVILGRDVLQVTRAIFADPAIGCVTGHIDYVNGAESPTARVGAGYWSADEALKQLETASGSCMGADGSLFAIRAATFRTVPENIIDDFFTSMSVLCDGWRCIYSPDLTAWERSATRSGEEYRRKVRIGCRAFNCHRLLWPRLRTMGPLNLYKYLSHKLLRWLLVYWLGAALVCVLIGLAVSTVSWTVFGLLVALGLVVAAAVALIPGRPWSYGREVFLAVLATGVGVIKSLQGERFQTWVPATSTRGAGLK